MNNRWSDAARTAALAVRQARALAGRPVAGKPKPRKALSMHKPSPVVYPGGTATFDERTGKRVLRVPGRPPSLIGKIERPLPIKVSDPGTSGSKKVPPMNVWVPPPDDPHWSDPKFVESFNKATGAKVKIKPPNIFYSSAYPYGPGQEGGTQGIIRYDPNDPDLATRIGYKTGKKNLPPVRSRVVIGGKVYIRSGNKLIPYR